MNNWGIDAWIRRKGQSSTTQIQDIFYFSDVPDVFFGDGLPKSNEETWINTDGNDIGFQNLDE